AHGRQISNHRENSPFDLDAGTRVLEKLQLSFDFLHGAHARPFLPSHTMPFALHLEHGLDAVEVDGFASDDSTSSIGPSYLILSSRTIFLDWPMKVPLAPTSIGGASSFFWNMLSVCNAACPLPYIKL